MGEFLLLKIFFKTGLNWGIYTPNKNSARWLLTRPEMAFRSTRRSTSQRSNFWLLSLPVDRPVDRANPESRLLSGRSTARSTVPSLTVDRPADRPHPRVGHLQSVDRPVDRLKWLVSVHNLVHVGRPVRSTARAWQAGIRDWKTGYFNSNKFS